MKIIGITQRTHLFEPYGELWECLDSALPRFLADLGFLSVALSFSQMDNIEPILSVCDCILLSGGNDLGECESRDRFESALLAAALKRNKKVIGLCRGMQVIATHFGVNLSKSRHKIRDAYSLCGDLNYTVHCYHKYCIDAPAGESLRKNGFRILATSKADCCESCEIEAFCNENLLAISWHIERELESYTKAANAKLISEFLRT